MSDSNQLINSATGRPWDLNSLVEKVLELQEQLVQSQEHNITLTAQLRELERGAHDYEDMKVELGNQNVLLADKAKENKYLHQELSRMSSTLSGRLLEIEETKTQIADLLHQLKTCQSERDVLAMMLIEAENAAKAAGKLPVPDKDQTGQVSRPKYTKGKQT